LLLLSVKTLLPQEQLVVLKLVTMLVGELLLMSKVDWQYSHERCICG